MSDEPVKKSFFARINEALYETVETDEKGRDLETGEAGGRGPAAGAAAPAADQSLGNPPELAARVRADIEGRGQALTQFLALASSFTEIIPEESGRYRAAMKALEKPGTSPVRRSFGRPTTSYAPWGRSGRFSPERWEGREKS